MPTCFEFIEISEDAFLQVARQGLVIVDFVAEGLAEPAEEADGFDAQFGGGFACVIGFSGGAVAEEVIEGIALVEEAFDPIEEGFVIGYGEGF